MGHLLLKVAGGVIAGIAGAAVASYGMQKLMPNATPMTNNLVAVGLAGVGALAFASSPFVAAGLATGLLLVPGLNFVAGLLTPASAPAPATTGVLYPAGTLGLLYGRGDLGDLGGQAARDAADDALLARFGIVSA